MRRLAFLIAEVSLLGMLAYEESSRPDVSCPAHLAKIQDEDLLQVADCYKKLSALAVCESAVSCVNDDIRYLVATMPDRNMENWKEVDTKLKALTVELSWKWMSQFEASTNAERKINADVSLSPKQKQEKLQELQTKAKQNCKEVSDAIRYASSHGWKLPSPPTVAKK